MTLTHLQQETSDEFQRFIRPHLSIYALSYGPDKIKDKLFGWRGEALPFRYFQLSQHYLPVSQPTIKYVGPLEMFDAENTHAEMMIKRLESDYDTLIKSEGEAYIEMFDGAVKNLSLPLGIAAAGVGGVPGAVLFGFTSLSPIASGWAKMHYAGDTPQLHAQYESELAFTIASEGAFLGVGMLPVGKYAGKLAGKIKSGYKALDTGYAGLKKGYASFRTGFVGYSKNVDEALGMLRSSKQSLKTPRPTFPEGSEIQDIKIIEDLKRTPPGVKQVLKGKEPEGVYSLQPENAATQQTYNHYIKQDGRYYQVEWDETAHTWRHLEFNELGQKKSYLRPVKLNSEGRWQTNTDLPGKGGRPPSINRPEIQLDGDIRSLGRGASKVGNKYKLTSTGQQYVVTDDAMPVGFKKYTAKQGYQGLGSRKEFEKLHQGLGGDKNYRLLPFGEERGFYSVKFKMKDPYPESPSKSSGQPPNPDIALIERNLHVKTVFINMTPAEIKEVGKRVLTKEALEQARKKALAKVQEAKMAGFAPPETVSIDRFVKVASKNGTGDEILPIRLVYHVKSGKFSGYYPIRESLAEGRIYVADETALLPANIDTNAKEVGNYVTKNYFTHSVQGDGLNKTLNELSGGHDFKSFGVLAREHQLAISSVQPTESRLTIEIYYAPPTDVRAAAKVRPGSNPPESFAGSRPEDMKGWGGYVERKVVLIDRNELPDNALATLKANIGADAIKQLQGKIAAEGFKKADTFVTKGGIKYKVYVERIDKEIRVTKIELDQSRYVQTSDYPTVSLAKLNKLDPNKVKKEPTDSIGFLGEGKTSGDLRPENPSGVATTSASTGGIPRVSHPSTGKSGGGNSRVTKLQSKLRAREPG